jgi:hypothetical protein
MYDDASDESRYCKKYYFNYSTVVVAAAVLCRLRLLQQGVLVCLIGQACYTGVQRSYSVKG